MTLFIEENCRMCSEIRESLDATAIAHETVVVPAPGRSKRLPVGTEPPVLVDDGHVVQGNRDVSAYIEELRQLRDEWLKYQSDVCYGD
jgi:hypothetical protein